MIRFLAAIALLFVLTCGAIFFLLENPTRFKTQIAQLAESATGYQVEIKGDLSWRYWPPIAIRAEQLTLSANNGAFAEFTIVEADVDLIPLLTGQRALNVERIVAVGGAINLNIDAQGLSNWTLAEPTSSAAQLDTDPAKQSLIPSLQALEIRDLVVSYDNLATSETYSLELDNLTTDAIKPDTPFVASSLLTLTDHSNDNRVAITTTGRIWVDADATRIGFEELVSTINANLDGTRWPNATVISDGEWRADTQTLSFTRLNLQTQHAQAAYTGLVNLSGDEPRADGIIQFESANPSAFSALLGTEIPITLLTLDSDIAATPTSVSFKAFEGRFDESVIKGSFSYVDAATKTMPKLRAEVRIDQLNLDNPTYTDPSKTSNLSADNGAPPGESNTNASASDTELFPVDTLREIDVNFIARIEQLTTQGYQFSQVKFELKSQNARMETIVNTNGFDGKIVASANTTLNAPVTTDLQVSMDQLDMVKIAESDSFSGKLTGTSSLSFVGHKMSHLQTSLNGKTVFNVADGELDVRAIKNLAQTIDSLRNKRSSISDWPNLMPFENLNGQHVFNTGTTDGQVLTAQVENLSIAAFGGFNLMDETMLWDVTAMFQQTDTGQFKVSKQLSGIRWPMTCQGSIDAPSADLCFGQEGAIGSLVADILKQDLQRRGTDRVEELIEDKVPEELKELTRDLFKDIFKRP